MKNYLFIFALLAFVLTSCENKSNTHTTNLSTYGIVQNQEGEVLQGIAIITKVEGFERIDTAYTQKTGEFYTRVSKIPYPIPEVTVTAMDPKGIYQTMSQKPHYMYECGTDFVPENNFAFPEDGIIFVLTK